MADHVRQNGRVPVFGSNGVVGEHDAANTEGPVIVIGRKGSHGKLQYSEAPVFAIDTTYYVDRRATDTNMRWLFYALSTVGLGDLSQDVGVPGLSREAAYSQRLPVPPKAVQEELADFLDAETAGIDALVTLRERMVGLLRDRLRMLVWVTTYGGVHERRPLRRLVSSVQTGSTPSTADESWYTDGEVAWYTPGDVNSHLSLRPAARVITADAVRHGHAPTFPADSTLLVGIGATAGRVAHLDHKASGNQQMTCLVPAEGVSPRFLSWQLWCRAAELRALAPFTTLPILSNDYLRSVLVAVPAIDEQRRIVRTLDVSTARMTEVTFRLDRQIALLRERRQALITAAVTGEIDVTKGAA